MKKTFKFDTFSVDMETASIPPKELAVLTVLEQADGAKLHQSDIAKSEPYLGCDPKYEADLPIPNPTASTLRNIRGIINRLRRKYHAPIISEPKRNGGYWIPKKEAEIRQNMIDWRIRALHQALGNLRTYDDELETFKDIPGPPLAEQFFEDLRRFLESYVKPPKPKPPKKNKKKKPPPDDENGGQGELPL